ncbi:MAG: response regulator [Chloroflexi bacterium]|nr:response regulator [Chloroflexota bacterium]
MAKILIAEDHFPNQRLISYRLRHQGHSVVGVDNGVDALEHIQNQVFDLAILDIGMPKMDGITTLKHIRAEAKTRFLPVIMLTASALHQQENAATSAGANCFLHKPISSQELNEAVDSLILKENSDR